MKYQTRAYIIQCITNLHAGSGDANYGVVDNLVQRDPVSKFPVIHSSSLKGALRQHFKEEYKESSDALQHIFGVDAGTSSTKYGVGHYKFFEADLLAYPVRSSSRPYFIGSSSQLVAHVENRARALGLDNLNINPFDGAMPQSATPLATLSCKVEGYQTRQGLQLNQDVVSKYFDNNEMINFHQDDIYKIIKRLPVIARNQLDNGESKNLWYEEVVPRESRFIFFVSIPEEDKHLTDFEKLENATVQIGANGSIGYGYCELKRVVS